MSKTNRSNKRKSHNGLETTVIIAIIAGVSGLLGTIVTTGPSWISTLGDIKLFQNITTTPTSPPLPAKLIHEALPPTDKIAPIRLDSLEVTGREYFFPPGVLPSEVSGTPREQRIPSTTKDITLYFTLTGLATK